jgi:TolB-like protein/predicted Ser/Thr protein kinase
MDPEGVHVGASPGMTLGSYRIERVLGRGGMGTVFLAYDTKLHRQAALKLIDGPRNDDGSRARLLREARNAAALNHPNICTVYDVADANACAFIAMEYVEGRSLHDRIGAGAIPIADILRYAVQAADALGYAHDHGVIHRDFKAANAILTDTGRLKIVDFGLAQRGDTLIAGVTTVASLVPGGAAGTPYAMAPEQIRGEATDARTDIWALGVLLCEMPTTGSRPFNAATVPELFSSILRDSPANLPHTVPVEMAAVITRCLEKDPARRYQHAGEVRAALEAIQTGTAQWGAWRYRFSRRRWVIVAASFVAAVSVSVGLNVGGLRDRLRTGSANQAPIKLAVLPFTNLTGDAGQEYFSDGLTEEMITQLGRLQPARMSVIARTSSMRYKNADTAIDRIGRELGVDYVLEGSARREGNRVRITAILIQARDQTQRWSNTFERELSGILALQADVARGIAGSLALTLLPADQARLAGAAAIDPDAYEAYLRAREYSYQFTRASFDAAQHYYELALEKDPNYALPYAGLSFLWAARQQMNFVPPAQATPNMTRDAEKALALDPNLADAHYVLAIVKFVTDWDWPGAEQEFKAALALNPNLAEAHSTYSHLLNILKRPNEAMTEVEHALKLDPLNPEILAFYAEDLFMIRRYDDAITQFKAALQIAPDHALALAGLRDVLNQKQMHAEEVDVQLRLLGDGAVKDALRRGYEEGGYLQAMNRGCEAAATRSRATSGVVGNVVRNCLNAKRFDEAIEWLERSYELRTPQIVYIGALPTFDSIRGDPRFQALLRRLRLPS